MRDAAVRFGERFGRSPRFVGTESDVALLSDAPGCTSCTGGRASRSTHSSSGQRSGFVGTADARQADPLRDAGREVLSATPAEAESRLAALRGRLAQGLVIPAHPLALTASRRLDERRQRALTRYYLAANAGGVAVGVHTTQFAIHDPGIGLYRPVLEARRRNLPRSGRPAVLVAGVIGPTRQAVAEAETAVELGYDAALLSLARLRVPTTTSSSLTAGR